MLSRAVNVPDKLLDELDAHAAEHGTRPLLIHISTDQACATLFFISPPGSSHACAASAWSIALQQAYAVHDN